MSGDFSDEFSQKVDAIWSASPDFPAAGQKQGQTIITVSSRRDLGQQEAFINLILVFRPMSALPPLPPPQCKGRLLDPVLFGESLATHPTLLKEIENLLLWLGRVSDPALTVGPDYLADVFITFIAWYDIYQAYRRYHPSCQMQSVGRLPESGGQGRVRDGKPCRRLHSQSARYRSLREASPATRFRTKI